MKSALVCRLAVLPCTLPVFARPARRRARACRAGSIQTHAVPRAPATAAGQGPDGRAPESPSSHPHRRPPRAAVASCTGR